MDQPFRARLDGILRGAGVKLPSERELNAALTHSSFGNESGEPGEDNERLEFLGDAVLGLCVAEMLYDVDPGLEPGDMTRLRAELVSGEALAAVAVDWRVGEALRLGKGEEANGGRLRPSNLSRAVEAVLGAVFLAGGYGGACAIARAAIGGRLSQIVPDAASRDPKSALQEWAQAHGAIPAYKVIARGGPDHAPQWTVSVNVGASACEASALTLRRAEKEAARALLARLAAPAPEGLL